MGFSPESEEMFEKDRQHSPRDDYLKRLRIGDLDLSVINQTLDWIWKACEELIKFGPLSIFLANNYLDRFLFVHDLPSGKAWTVQLLAVACLSLAAKIEETKVLELIHLQVLTSWSLELHRLLLHLLFRFMENLTHYTLTNSPSLLSSHTLKRWLLGCDMSKSKDHTPGKTEFVPESLFREDDIFYETIMSRLEKAFGFCKNEQVCNDVQQKESKFCTLEVVRKLDSLTNKGLYLIAMILTTRLYFF